MHVLCEVSGRSQAQPLAVKWKGSGPELRSIGDQKSGKFVVATHRCYFALVPGNPPRLPYSISNEISAAHRMSSYRSISSRPLRRLSLFKPSHPPVLVPTMVSGSRSWTDAARLVQNPPNSPRKPYLIRMQWRVRIVVVSRQVDHRCPISCGPATAGNALGAHAHINILSRRPRSPNVWFAESCSARALHRVAVAGAAREDYGAGQVAIGCQAQTENPIAECRQIRLCSAQCKTSLTDVRRPPPSSALSETSAARSCSPSSVLGTWPVPTA